MSKAKIAKITRAIVSAAKHYTPEILVGTGIVSFVTATVFAVKATPKAVKAIEEKEKQIENDLAAENVEVQCPVCGEMLPRDLEEISTHMDECHPEYDEESIKDLMKVKLTTKEIIATCWKYYIPTIAGLIGGGACVLGSNRISAKRGAELLSAYKLSQLALEEYKDKTLQICGPKKEEEVRASINQDHVNRKWKGDGNDVIDTKKGKTLCFDALTGRFFLSDINELEKAVNIINSRMLRDGLCGYSSLNEFYCLINLPDAKLGEYLGWSVCDGNVELSPSSGLTSSGTPYYTVDFNIQPHYGYDMQDRYAYDVR